MFSEDLIEHIVSETNWFAQECIAAKPDTEWHGMTLKEMKAFLRVHLLFGIKQLPANHLYWSSNPLIGVLSVEKACQKIILTNCLSTFIWIPTQDKFCKKIQDITSCSKFAPFWIMLLKIVETLWPGRNLSVDEAMVKFKGHLGMKQYLPVKPVKRGISVGLCRSVKWVCLWFPSVYLKETTWHGGTKSWISCCSWSNAELCSNKVRPILDHVVENCRDTMTREKFVCGRSHG